jgi:hypothetical protein
VQHHRLLIVQAGDQTEDYSATTSQAARFKDTGSGKLNVSLANITSTPEDAAPALYCKL